ncbi:MAG TPA: C45 family peptidase [Bryobacteraceae bacterium]|nr:C45 family peptidase [Bryobacteraceae bacterium]
MKRTAIWLGMLALAGAASLISRDPAPDPRLKDASRESARNGWIMVHLKGSPGEIGFQHGYLLTPEIEDTFKDISLESTHDERRDWQFFRNVARDVYWPHIEEEYRRELTGIVDGLAAHGSKLDLWDIVALNAWLEQSYYDKSVGSDPEGAAAEHCSAFVATGSYTKDGRVVIGHNNWTSYASGERWNVIFDITPERGNRILMDGMAGLIHSGDDFGVNSAGLAITETTISGFKGFDVNGVPEFVRARKAMQYANNVDDFARIMEDGNNGGYANTWLVADRKNNEIASLELGLKNVTLQRTSDGFFVGANYPSNPKLIQEETEYDPNDRGGSGNARHVRWLELMAQYKGKIDVAAGEKFLGDHFDSFEGKTDPDERTLCGHIDLSPRGVSSWWGPYGWAGTVQNKVTDAAGIARMAFMASLGHSCGLNFIAAPYLSKHPEFAWARTILGDLNSHPWTAFAAK